MKLVNWFKVITLAASLPLLSACQHSVLATDQVSAQQPEPQTYVKLTHPDWAKNASLYQINLRQFTEQGTLAAAQQQLPRLKALGVDILWLMPIHPIGEENRKGSLGSPYSVKDYYGVNAEFGTLDDLKNFVNAAHEQGMYVILDWVANHTAWDNNLRFDHPDWYEKDRHGNFRPTPWWDWSDIIDLDYSKPEVRQYMTQAMAYWVKEANIDGFRCDVAGFVPIDFWENTRAALEQIKPVFMLAEWEMRDLHANAFDATYAWSWQQTVHNILSGHSKDLSPLFVYYSWNESAYPKNIYRMTYVTNHDANAWEGTVFERYGSEEKVATAIVLSVLGEGMPLIYNGLEAGNDRRLAFFEKDPITWQPHPFNQLITQLLALQKSNTALWHANYGATMERVWQSEPDSVLSFVR
ncbi:alpha-amylase family glycosyl hydrolase [Colwellia sp. MEBiC06753]